MIESNQSALMKGRLLLENMLLATELVNGYHLPTISSRCKIKLDISKSFEPTAMGLPAQFFHKVYLCISTTSFSVEVNGELMGYFPSARAFGKAAPYLPTCT